LKGIIIHQGLSEAGHYFSLIRLNGKWFEFNDKFIEEVKEFDV
jgi:ubiquitin C-terminal hydrolase